MGSLIGTSITNMETEVDGVTTWLLPLDQAVNVAVGEYEFVHIVDQPEYISIPRTPEYCKHVILWNENIVPVINLSSWFYGHEQSEDAGVVAILIYNNSEGELLYGGIKLINIPVLDKVKNDQGCSLPGNADKWKEISLSCFKSCNGEVVPILDVAALFLQGAES